MLALKAVCSSCNTVAAACPNEARLTASTLCASPWMLSNETLYTKSKATTNHSTPCNWGIDRLQPWHAMPHVSQPLSGVAIGP